MTTVSVKAVHTQEAISAEEGPAFDSNRKVGVEIAPSAALSSRYFHGPKRYRGGRSFAFGSDGDWADRVAKAQ
jgi:hypothetical protein